MWSLRWLQPAAGSQHQARQLFYGFKIQWPRPRTFALSTRRLANKRPPQPAKKANAVMQKSSRTAPAGRSSGGGYKSFSDVLAARPSPTLLYQSSSPILYITGCYILSGFCFGYAGWNFYSTYLHPPEMIGYWIPIMVGGVCVAMAFFGTWLFFGVRFLSQLVVIF